MAEAEKPANDNFDIALFDASFSPSARPDRSHATPWYRDRQYLWAGWRAPSIWKSAAVECVATGCVVFITGQITATLTAYHTKQPGAYVGITSTVLLILFIYATAPASGGHLNPMITLTTMLSGLCPIARGVMYMCAQTIGAAAAGGLLRGVWGPEVSKSVHGGGCFFDQLQMTHGRVFLNEICTSFILLYLVYGVGLDPRQAELHGPHAGPVLVGLSLGLVAFASSSMAPGYAGAQMNPARCFSYGITRMDMSDQWIWWVGPGIASVLLAALYQAIPPHHSRKHSRSDSEATLNV